MIRRTLAALAFFWFFVWLVSLGGPWRAVVTAACYVLLGYVVFRAWPAIRGDLRWLTSHRIPLPHRRRGGDYL